MLFYIFENSIEIFTSELFLTTLNLSLLLFGAITIKKYPKNAITLFFNNIIPFFLLFGLKFLLKPYFFFFINDIFIFDNFSKFLKITIIIFTFFFFFIQLPYIKKKFLLKFEINIIIIFSIIALMLLISSFNLITLYISIELQSLSFYILAASNKKSPLSIEASLKYFILGSIASSFILYGSSIIYGILGTTCFSNINCILLNIDEIKNLYLIISFFYGLFFVLIGLLFKIGAAPFHSWVPDVYDGSPNNITAFFAIIPKIIIIGLIYRIFFDILEFLKIIFFICSLLSIIIGSFITLQQKKIKRLIAYSSISHVGFILIGFVSNSLQSLQDILLYIVIYVIMATSIWTIILSSFINNKPLKYLTDFSNFSKLNLILSFIIIFNFFSIAGIPPLAGFFSKMFIFYSAIKENIFSLVIIGVLASIINTFYYIRLMKIIFFDNIFLIKNLKQFSKNSSLILLINFQLILYFFIFPDLLLILLKKNILLFII